MDVCSTVRGSDLFPWMCGGCAQWAICVASGVSGLIRAVEGTRKALRRVRGQAESIPGLLPPACWCSQCSHGDVLLATEQPATALKVHSTVGHCVPAVVSSHNRDGEAWTKGLGQDRAPQVLWNPELIPHPSLRCQKSLSGREDM